MISRKIYASSESAEWETPQELFDKLDAEYHFDVDVCATQENAKCARYYTLEDDGLKHDWQGTCWMNPPYGRDIQKWMGKAYTESRVNGATVVCLVPSRTDTKWWHEYAMRGKIQFLRGRIKFGQSKNSAPFPSAIVAFGDDDKREVRTHVRVDEFERCDKPKGWCTP